MILLVINSSTKILHISLLVNVYSLISYKRPVPRINMQAYQVELGYFIRSTGIFAGKFDSLIDRLT